ncbi:uncharacterized protein LOC144655021 isoform X2 [Oculina patagonica]
MKAAIFVVCVLFCLLVPSRGASSDYKNVSTSKCFYLHSSLARVCKDHPVSLAVMVITGYQAATAEMARKVTRAWLVHLGHVVLKETQDKMVQTLTTETGNSVRGGATTAVTLVLSRTVFLTRKKTIPHSVWFIKATFICMATTAVRDGSLPLMAPSAAVHCPLTSFSGCQEVPTWSTNPDQ